MAIEKPHNLKEDDKKHDSPINYIINRAQSEPLSLGSAPTTAGGELPNNGDWGHVGADLFINLSGTVYKYTGSAV